MRRIFVLLPVVALAAFNACDCTQAPTPAEGEGEAGCVLDVDCADGDVCRDNLCVASIAEGEGEGGQEGEGEGEGEGEATGILTVLPDDDVDFGATRIGTAVDRTVTLKNTGDAPLTIFQIVLDDDSGSFAAEPVGAVALRLEPDEETGLLLSHTANDGRPDAAELNLLHDGAPQLTTIRLTGSFKGEPEPSVTTTPEALFPDVTLVDLGQVPVGQEQTVVLLVRNRGSRDSVVAVDRVTLTPASGVFSTSFAELSTALLPGFLGNPDETFAITARFSPTEPGPASATITIGFDLQGTPSQLDVELTGTGTTGRLQATPAASTSAPSSSAVSAPPSSSSRTSATRPSSSAGPRWPTAPSSRSTRRSSAPRARRRCCRRRWPPPRPCR